MKYLTLLLLAFVFQSAQTARAASPSRSQELIVVLPRELPEAAQLPGESMAIHSFSNGNTYLYIEQKQGARLAVFDVADPAHIKTIGAIDLSNSSPFDFVRDLDDSDTLICFRDNRGSAVVDFRKAKAPTIVRVDALRQAVRAEAIGYTGLLMVAQPRRDSDVPFFDYQVVDISDPRRPELLTTVSRVQNKITDPSTGATYLLGSEGLTVIRQPRVEENHRRDMNSN